MEVDNQNSNVELKVSEEPVNLPKVGDKRSANCWSCNALKNMRDGKRVEKYKKDGNGKLLRVLKNKKKGEWEFVNKKVKGSSKVLCDDYSRSCVQDFNIESVEYQNRKCRVIGHCSACKKQISTFVKL